MTFQIEENLKTLEYCSIYNLLNEKTITNQVEFHRPLIFTNVSSYWKELHRIFGKYKSLVFFSNLIILFHRNQTHKIMEKINSSAQSYISTESFDHDTSHNQVSDIQKRIGNHQFETHFKRFLSKHDQIKDNLAFWNSLVDLRFENMIGTINLIILLLFFTFANSQYTGYNSDGPDILGWISVAQVLFFYALIILLKAFYLPSLVAQLQKNPIQGLLLYRQVYYGKKRILNLSMDELQLLLETIKQKGEFFRSFLSSKAISELAEQIQATLKTSSIRPYQYNYLIDNVKLRQKNAKYWQSFWVNFVASKTFTVPGIILLHLIITSITNASIAQSSIGMCQAQGYIGIGIWAIAILINIIIKCHLEGSLEAKVEKARSQPFVLYNSIYYNHKQFSQLKLNQLQEIRTILIERSQQFQVCFPEAKIKEELSKVQVLLGQNLPKKKNQSQQICLREIQANYKSAQNNYLTWHHFFEHRLILTITSVVKIILLLCITFVDNYPPTAQNRKNMLILMGCLCICLKVLGYLFYIVMRCSILDKLHAKAEQLNPQPFLLYRLVYFGNKDLKQLKLHELQNINHVLTKRKQQFVRCFPNTNPDVIQTEVHHLIYELADHKHSSNVNNLLKKQEKQYQSIAYWTLFCDAHLFGMSYGTFVFITQLIVSIIKGNAGAASALGWFGIALASAALLIFSLFKFYLLDHMQMTARALKIEGFSEYKLVYNKKKELRQVDVKQLERIEQIIQSLPLQFGRCFPKADPEEVLAETKEIIKSKRHLNAKLEIHFFQGKTEHQVLNLELQRTKNLLHIWSFLVRERIYGILPFVLVSAVLWVQSITQTLYGRTVIGFLILAGFGSIMLSILVFFNCYYKSHLKKKIQQLEKSLGNLENDLGYA